MTAGYLVLALATGVADAAGACRAQSGSTLAPLVELYTSEGCSSCPPADRWLAATFPPGAQSPAAIALAFHVDYWDRLGWQDRFARPAFTARQETAMRANGSTFVYTPQILLQGRDVPPGGRGRIVRDIDRARTLPSGAQIVIEAITPRLPADPAQAPQAAPPPAEAQAPGRVDAGGVPTSDAVRHLRVRVRATLPDETSRAAARLWLAYVDNDLATVVKAGENRGLRLVHDHVVRSLHGPFAADVGGVAAGEVLVPLPGEGGTAPSLVAFVQDPRRGAVLQALRLPLAGGECLR